MKSQQPVPLNVPLNGVPLNGVELTIAGSGEIQEYVAECSAQNLAIKFLGNCDSRGLRSAYGDIDICVFPSLADEWGMVPIEALASGVPVLGSIYAQAVETVIEEGSNGWVFDPTDTESIENAIDRAMQCAGTELQELGHRAKASVAHISASAAADKFTEIVTTVLPMRRP